VRLAQFRLETAGEVDWWFRPPWNKDKDRPSVLDLERLLGRVALDSAGPREVMALAKTLGCLPGVVAAVKMFESARWRELGGSVDPLEDLHEMIVRTIAEEPPVSLGDGGAIREGVDAELDELRELSKSGRQSLAAIEERERARTGIGSLKVRFNTVFGYYLEVTKANAKAVPADYERKQTLVNAERFTTPELKEYETKILTAQERSGEIERRIFAELRRQLLEAAGRMRETARKVAEIDLLGCFAHLAALRGWVRPQVEESGVLEFVQARHPVVERRLEESGGGRFVPNSVYMDAGWGLKEVNGRGEQPTLSDETGKDGAPTGKGPAVLLITGPNMGGKSTYLRMAALLVVMAQMGGFVAARGARVGLVDRLFTRVGAGDNLARGESTFLVEMRETAHILRYATRKSLIILDEIGRGTSTYDGVSIAWAVAEHLHDHLRARALFATHYHELCALAETHPRVRNVSVAAREWKGEVVFLRKLVPGGASRSFGIEVARLAGLPGEVVARARAILGALEGERAVPGVPRPVHPGQGESPQLGLFSAPASDAPSAENDEALRAIGEALRRAQPDELSPRAAWDLLAELRKKLTPPP